MGPNASSEIHRLLIDSIAALRPESYLKAVAAAVDPRTVGRLGAIEVPTLVMVGEHDSLFPVVVSRAIARAVPGAELAIIEDAGHLSNLEQPRAFNAVLLEFLLRHRDLALP